MQAIISNIVVNMFYAIFFLPQKRNTALCMERIPHCHWDKRCTITHLLLLNYILIKKHMRITGFKSLSEE